jgi:hypothetical protein
MISRAWSLVTRLQRQQLSVVKSASTKNQSPSKIGRTQCSWIGVGLESPVEVQCLTMQSSRPNSENPDISQKTLLMQFQLKNNFPQQSVVPRLVLGKLPNIRMISLILEVTSL